MKTSNPRTRQQNADELLSLRDILDIFTVNWKWFILSVILCLAAARLYLATKPKIFQRVAVMLVKDDQSMGNARSKIGTDALMQLNGVMMGTSVKNEVYILQSHQLMKDVVRRLRLDVGYSCKSGLKTISLYDVRPFTAVFDTVETLRPYAFTVELRDGKAHMSQLVTTEGKQDFELTFNLGDTVRTPVGRMALLPLEPYLEIFNGKKVRVTHTTVEQATNAFGAALKSSELDKESTLVGIQYTDQNIQRAEDILNAVLEAYKVSIINDKNQVAESTAKFIDERIDLISRELSDVEGKLAQFKQQNRLVSFKEDATNYLQQNQAARQRSVQIEAQVGMVKYLLDNLRDKAVENNIIPTLGAITDAGLQTQIMKYNELTLERNRLIQNTSENSPRILQVDQNLAQMRQNIIATTESYLQSLNVQLRSAQQEERSVKGVISSVPEKEKEAMDIQRQQAIKETLYTYLLNKREETALQLAIQEANIRVVEAPFGSSNPIAPRTKVILLVALLIGIAAPFAYFHIRNLLNMSIRGRKDIEERTTIPVLGEIPHRKEGIDDAQILVTEQNTDAINESFRMMRFSLNFINKDARVIMFTSTTPGEGKTFISRNFSVTLGMAGKRVILIDSDIRKRTQSRLSGKTRGEGLTSYLSGNTDDISSLIQPLDEAHQVDMLPAGITPPNPSELLMSNRLELLIEELKKSYDYIVVDNVPAQVVADAGIVNRIADITIYVVREGKIDRRYLPELQRLYEEKKFNNLCILINDARIEKKRYGYGNGYGYGYGYGYGFDGLDNGKKNKKK